MKLADQERLRTVSEKVADKGGRMANAFDVEGPASGLNVNRRPQLLLLVCRYSANARRWPIRPLQPSNFDAPHVKTRRTSHEIAIGLN